MHTNTKIKNGLIFVFESCIYLIFFIYPFSRYRINIPTFFLFVSGISLVAMKKPKLFELKEAFKKNILLIWPFFLSVIFGVIHFKMLDIDFLVLNIPFLLIPILIYFNTEYLSKKFFEKLLFFASIGIFIFMFIRLGIGIQYYIEHNDADKLFYVQLLKDTGVHPTTLSLIINFVLFLGIYFLTISKIKKSIIKFGVIINILVMVLFLIFLASRTGLLFFVMFSFTLLIIFSIIKKKLIKYLLIFCMISVSLVFITKEFFPRTAKRFMVTTPKKVKNYEARKKTWKASINLIKKHFVLGLATPNNIKENLLHEFELIKYKKGQEHFYNAHNQFLEYFLLYGIIGFIFFVIAIFVGVFKSIKNSNFMLFLLSFLLVIYSMTETILESQNGIIFFVLLYSLSIFVFPKKELI